MMSSLSLINEQDLRLDMCEIVQVIFIYPTDPRNTTLFHEHCLNVYRDMVWIYQKVTFFRFKFKS